MRFFETPLGAGGQRTPFIILMITERFSLRAKID